MFLKIGTKLEGDLEITFNNTAKNHTVTFKYNGKEFKLSFNVNSRTHVHYLPEKIVNGYGKSLKNMFGLLLPVTDKYHISEAIVSVLKRYSDRDMTNSIWEETIVVNNIGLLKPLEKTKTLNYGVVPGVTYVTVERDIRNETQFFKANKCTLWSVKPELNTDGYILPKDNLENNEIPTYLFQDIPVTVVNAMIGLLPTFNETITRDIIGVYKVTIEKIEL